MCQKTKQGSSSMINVEDLPKIIFAIMGQKYSLLKMILSPLKLYPDYIRIYAGFHLM